MKSPSGSLIAEFPLQQGGVQCLKPGRHVQVPDVLDGDLTTPDLERLTLFTPRPHARQRPVESVGGNASLSIEPTILLKRQIAVPTQKTLAFPNGLVKGKIFQPVQRILSHHDLHGPKGRDRFAGPGNNLPETFAFFLRNRLH